MKYITILISILSIMRYTNWILNRILSQRGLNYPLAYFTIIITIYMAAIKNNYIAKNMVFIGSAVIISNNYITGVNDKISTGWRIFE